MPNRNSKAGTNADSDVKPIVTTSASIEASQLLNAVLPCPFCGGKPYEGHTGGLNYSIKCYNCGVEMQHDRRDKVRGHWNQRHCI